ncbi:hypothetical protein Q8F55_005342 [Vanrija albida]|uniref:Uncharacterized protein n=1 Tax=Vanrija albida TaxID=181172 RepID=A0ABR3Q1J3_9TREE
MTNKNKTSNSAQLLKPPASAPSPAPSGKRRIKESIRKMPSSLFPPSGVGSRANNSAPVRAPSRASSHSPTPTLNNPVPSSAAPKQPKTRKGLGNLFNWGTVKTKQTTTGPTQPLPSSKPPVASDARSARSAWARRQPSGNTLIVPENKQRPSCGPDPFGRPGHGAAVVAFPPIDRAPSAKEIEAERHAPSVKTVKDDFEDSWVADSSFFYAPPEGMATSSREDRRVSAPLLTSAPVTSLAVPAASVAPRSATFGFSSNVGGMPHAPPPAFSSRPTTPSQAEKKLTKTLKKDKTRSTVWGFFKGRKPKHKGGVASVAYPEASTEASSTKSLPKRKSLTDLFNLALRKSIDKMRVSPTSSPKKRGPQPSTPLRLQSVSEAKEAISRFGDSAFCADRSHAHTDAGSTLEEVVSATDELFDFMSNMPPSPAGMPVTKGTRASVQSLRHASQTITSPSQLRKVKSAFLLLAKGSPSRPTVATPVATPSLAHKSAMEEHLLTPVRKGDSSTPTSMVKLGQRNIFAPPSPVVSPMASSSRSKAMYLDISAQPRSRVSACSTGSGTSGEVMQFTPTKDIPNTTAYSDQFGLDLDVPRNPSGDVYGVSDSPVPPMPPRPSHFTFGTPSEAATEEGQQDYSSPTRRVSIEPPRLRSMDLGHPIQTSASLSELLSPYGSDDVTRGSLSSFDFTTSAAELSGGNDRASFMEAEHKSKTSSPSADFKMWTSPKYLAPPPAPYLAGQRQTTPQRLGDAQRQLTSGMLGPLPPLPPLPSPTLRVRASPVPFKGRTEFQMSFAQPKAATREVQTQTSGLLCPPPRFELPALPPLPQVTRQQKTQHRPAGSAAVSFASMSSLGAPIPGQNREYTNHFEKHFGSNNGIPPVPALPDEFMPKSSLGFDSTSRQRRLSSSSLASPVLEGDASLGHTGSARPRPHQSSTARGRSDWAAHRRNMSSGDSLSRIGRPGLGERMFQREEGVQLAAISGSPSESMDEQRRRAQHDIEINRLSIISTDSSQSSAASETEVFGSTIEPQSLKAFSLKARPLSDASTGSDDVEGVNDTFDNIRNSTPSKVKVYAGIGEGTPILDYQQTSVLSSLRPLREVASLATIPSLATLRPTSPQHHFTSDESQWDGEDIKVTMARRALIDVQREAEDEIRTNEAQWADNEEWREANESIEFPKTPAELFAFIAKSQMNFKPLDEPPTGGAVRHRRTSSMEARVTSGPYSGLIPPPVTRFQNKKGSTGSAISATTATTSSYGGFQEDFDVEISPLIAEFAREQLPYNKAATEPGDTLRAPGAQPSTLQVPHSVSRARVNSTERRQRLGWSRRRHSDEPEALLDRGVADLVAQPKSASAATFPTYHRETPSFITFSPDQRAQPDIRKQNEENLKAAAAFEANERPHARMPPPRPPRQREVAVHVSLSGSPINLHSLENGPTPALVPGRTRQSSANGNSSRRALAPSNPNAVAPKTSRGPLKGTTNSHACSYKYGSTSSMPAWGPSLPPLSSPKGARTHLRPQNTHSRAQHRDLYRRGSIKDTDAAGPIRI